MHPETDPLSAGEILNTAPRTEASSFVSGRVGNELSQTIDVQAARNYFQASGGNAQLPDVSFDAAGGQGTHLPELSFDSGSALSNPNGVETAFSQSITPGAESALSQPFATGMESGLAQPTITGLEGGMIPGLEQGALGAMPPGGEPISPLVQMILKMPGLTGIIGDFFSALTAFFFPADGGLMALLDPTMWAAAAQNAFTTLSTIVMHDIPLTFTSMGTTNPFQTLMQNGLLDGGKAAGAVGSPVTLSLEHQPFTAHSLNVGGTVGPNGSLYELSSMDGNQLVSGNAVNVDWNSNKFLAMENQNSFGPTIGGSQLPAAQMPSTSGVAPQQLQQQTWQQTAPGGYSGTGGDGATMQQMQQMQQPGSQTLDANGSPTNNTGTADSGTEIAGAAEVQPHHVVQRGDNLWNIARENLGSGQRWTEIYDLNKDVIGSNPDLIYSGTDLKLPGGTETIASNPSNYTVQPGDNLWNISRDHLGGGKNWHSLYEQNATTIGTNPDLIHPGQNLAIPDGGTQMQLAHGSPNPSATAGHAAPQAPHHTAHHSPHTAHHAARTAHTAHAKPAHDATAHSGTASGKEVAQVPDSVAGQAATAGAKTTADAKAIADAKAGAYTKASDAQPTGDTTKTAAADTGLTAVARSL